MLIPYASLQISPDRQRRHFDEKKLQELAMSISSKGLLHAPVVRELADGSFVLVAGERRYRAIGILADTETEFSHNGEAVPPGMLPVTRLSDLSPLEIEEAELEENVVRENLTWQEQVRATERLDSLRRKQAEEKGISHSFTSTASEILGIPAQGYQVSQVAEAVALAKHLDNPEVAAAKTQKEAVKILRKQAEQTHRAKLAEMVDIQKVPHTLIHGDSLAELSKLTGPFDVILTDPPYGVDAQDFSDQALITHNYQDSWEYAKKCYTTLAWESFRLSAPQAHAYIFCDVSHFEEVKALFSLAGWQPWERPLIWAKNIGMLPAPDYGPRNTYETILFCNKGKKKVHKVGADVLFFPHDPDKMHGAQKPVGLYVELLSRSALPGARILDPFAGSGTIFPACNALKLIGTGIEINQMNHTTAVTRLESTPSLEI